MNKYYKRNNIGLFMVFGENTSPNLSMLAYG